MNMSENIHHIIRIADQQSGKRLDQVVAESMPEFSRARLQSWIKSGEIKLNDNIVKPGLRVKTGDLISIDARHEIKGEWKAENIPLEILFEDQSIIILNKPPGLVVHPGAGNPEHTLLNALLHHEPDLETVPRAGIVQRLDKNTSGIMIIARTPEAHTCLVSGLQSRQIKREYQAVVTGTMTAGGTIIKPVGRHPRQRTKMSVTETGKEAITHYRIIKKYPDFTHLRVTLETGRTHQIRVHMAHIHHPVLGDPVYSGRKRIPGNMHTESLAVIQNFPRQALHASLLKFSHPDSGQMVKYEAPLPADMQQLLDILEYEAKT